MEAEGITKTENKDEWKDKDGKVICSIDALNQNKINIIVFELIERIKKLEERTI